jgi:hypothetical protein
MIRTLTALSLAMLVVACTGEQKPEPKPKTLAERLTGAWFCDEGGQTGAANLTLTLKADGAASGLVKTDLGPSDTAGGKVGGTVTTNGTWSADEKANAMDIKFTTTTVALDDGSQPPATSSASNEFRAKIVSLEDSKMQIQREGIADVIACKRV